MKSMSILACALVFSAGMGDGAPTRVQRPDPRFLDRLVAKLPGIIQDKHLYFISSPQGPRPPHTTMKIDASLLPSGISNIRESLFVKHNLPRRGTIPNQHEGLHSLAGQFDTVCVRSALSTLRHVYTYDGSGKVTLDLVQYLSGRSWDEEYRVAYTYTTRGMLASMTEVSARGEICYRLVCTYDSFGRFASSTSEVNNFENGLNTHLARVTVAYDINGNCILSQSEAWDNGKQQHGCRAAYAYDEHSNAISYSFAHWSNDQWINQFRSFYSYSENGRNISRLDEQWLKGEWVTLLRSSISYDQDGRCIAELGEEWSDLGWTNSWLITTYYDQHGNLIRDVSQEWLGNQWVIVAHAMYTHDIAGRPTSGLAQEWADGQWVNTWHWLVMYAANGNVLSDSDTSWSGGRIDFCSAYTYDPNGQETSGRYEKWDNGHLSDGNRWVKLFDEYDLEISSQTDVWSEGQWVPDSRYNRTYNSEHRLTSILHSAWINSSWVASDSSHAYGMSGWSMTDSSGNQYDFGPFCDITFSYSEKVTSSACEKWDIPGSPVLMQNYPNPFNPTTTIPFSVRGSQFTSLKVYDVLGREVATLVNETKTAGSYTVRFDASGLASGVYVYRLTAGEFVQSRRLVLLK